MGERDKRKTWLEGEDGKEEQRKSKLRVTAKSPHRQLLHTLSHILEPHPCGRGASPVRASPVISEGPGIYARS